MIPKSKAHNVRIFMQGFVNFQTLERKEILMAEASTLYKLVILYMLRKVTFPLTNAQITEFIVGKEYTDYFHVQEAINDLLDAKLISGERIRNTSQYHATIDGENTLEYFSYMISDAIKADIDEYMRENAFEMRNEFLRTLLCPGGFRISDRSLLQRSDRGGSGKGLRELA